MRINEVAYCGGWVGSGTAPGRRWGGDSFFDFSFTTTATAPIRRIHCVRITAICIRHGSIKEKSGRGNRSGHALIGDIH